MKKKHFVLWKSFFSPLDLYQSDASDSQWNENKAAEKIVQLLQLYR